MQCEFTDCSDSIVLKCTLCYFLDTWGSFEVQFFKSRRFNHVMIIGCVVWFFPRSLDMFLVAALRCSFIVHHHRSGCMESLPRDTINRRKKTNKNNNNKKAFTSNNLGETTKINPGQPASATPRFWWKIRQFICGFDIISAGCVSDVWSDQQWGHLARLVAKISIIWRKKRPTRSSCEEVCGIQSGLQSFW